MKVFKSAGAALLAVCLTQFTAQAIAAQEYPLRPIRLIVPLAPGGAMDTIARSVGQKVGPNLGQTIVVDNRGGGGGTVGAGIAKAADADGYTLIMMSATSVIRPLLYKANYVMFRDFTPISQVSAQPYLLVVHPSLPVRSVRDLVALAKASPGKLNYASAGQGSIIHLATELLSVNTGIRMVHVPYKGMGAAYPELIAGHTQLALGSIVSALPHARSGRLRAIAVSSPRRSKTSPDIPTVAESGVPGYAVTNWYGVLAPAKTPRPVIERLHREISAVLHHPDMMKRFAADGAEAVGSTPEAFRDHIKDEMEKWAQVIRKAGLKGN
jgi:tripartite-type tricarboxylate transporter receptor subunit TctC